MATQPRDFDPNSGQADFNHAPGSQSRKAAWKQGATYLSLLLLGAGATFSGSYLSARNQLPWQEGNSQALAAPPNILPPTSSTSLAGTAGSNFITAVVEKVGPAVVRIDSKRTVKSEAPEVLNDPFFRRFFGSEMPVPPENRVERGTGSGFILNSNGQILTNAHVVEGSDTVTVTLKDGRHLQGKVLGVDPVTDVAVVKIEANNLPSVSIGN